MQTDRLSKLGRGSYILILHLEHTNTISVGKRRKWCFPAGYFAYVGSALGPGGLASRLKHHICSTASPHWHIDYLRPGTRLIELWISEFPGHLEHQWAAFLYQFHKTVRIFKGFGCSDCKCPSHLFYFSGRPAFRRFKKGIASRSGKHGPIQRILLN
jgi:Uri superfamily endonuclease